MAKSPKSSIDTLAKGKCSSGNSSFTIALVVFTVILLIVWFLLYAFRPVFIQQKDEAGNPTGEMRPSVALGVAFGIAVIASILAYLLHYLM